MDILNLSTSKLVTSIEFSKSPSSSNIIRFHGWCSFFNVVRMKRTMQKGYNLDAVGNTRSIIVFSHKTVSMEVNPWREVIL